MGTGVLGVPTPAHPEESRTAASRLGWRFVDVVALSLLIELDDALMSPLTVAFAVLVVASAFWARADQILQTTLLSMAGYILLVLIYRLNHADLDRPYRHFHYLVGLALLGLMLISPGESHACPRANLRRQGTSMTRGFLEVVPCTWLMQQRKYAVPRSEVAMLGEVGSR